jgi:eukaryotic-like serine/threonine-protein kinase
VSLPAGTRLGPYQIATPLGTGGMGEVYQAIDTRLNRTVALKVVRHDHADDPIWRERFDREARAISALSHSNICTLYDVGRQDGTWYVVGDNVQRFLVNQTTGTAYPAPITVLVNWTARLRK